MSSKSKHIRNSNILLEERFIKSKSLNEQILNSALSKALSSTFGEVAQEIIDIRDKIDVKKLLLPPHVRALMDFITLRFRDINENFFTEGEIEAIKNMVRESVKRGNYNRVVNFYDLQKKFSNQKIDWKNKKDFGLDQLSISNDYLSVAMTLGNATLKKTGKDTYVIQDKYDFNNFYDNPEKYDLSNLPRVFKDSMERIGDGNYIQGIERLLSFYHKFGYEGIDINISITLD
jgi:hypothetical protein